MCGILFIGGKRVQAQPDFWAPLQAVNARRGPDHNQSVSVHLGPSSSTSDRGTATLFSSVLGTRAPLTPQPHQWSENSADSEPRFALAWNGQVWQGMEALAPPKADDQEEHTNDGAALFTAIVFAAMVERYWQRDEEPSEEEASSYQITSALVHVLKSIDGPYAFVLLDRLTSKVYYARDPVGRRSLLSALTPEGQLVLASTGCAESVELGLVEVSCEAVWCADLNDPSQPHEAISRESELTKPLTLKELRFEGSSENVGSAPSREAAAAGLEAVLSQAVSVRVRNICSPDASNIASPLAILYSGGLDSAVLAALANQHYPAGPLELLTVAFANPRVLAAAATAVSSSSISSKSSKGAVPQPTKGPYDTPDRITARAGLEELRRIAPEREWRLIEIDVTPTEYELAKAEIENTMRPADSVMDLSIAAALHFAARGQGWLETSTGVREAYTSQARVLISGLGADELLGGYGRHRKAWERGGAEALAIELQLDISRLHARNLGRDDRIISAHGREVRHPFLDRDVLQYVVDLPLGAKMDLSLPAGTGDKRVLRDVARSLGLQAGAENVKRAIQFGARSAKMGMDEGRIKGHERLKQNKEDGD